MHAARLVSGKYSANYVIDGEGEEYRGSLEGLLALIAEYRKRTRTKRPKGVSKP
jgi:hypothetical protein